MLLASKDADLKLEVKSAALGSSNGHDLVTVSCIVRNNLTEAERTFAWWLVAKLHEAEGIANEGLIDPYWFATLSLEKRLTELAKRGERVKSAEKWMDNMKEWNKLAMDANKVNIKTEGMPIFVSEGGRPAWRANKVSLVHPSLFTCLEAASAPLLLVEKCADWTT